MKGNNNIERFVALRLFKFECLNKSDLRECILSSLLYKWKYLNEVILPIKTYEILQITVLHSPS
jgi:hypothetical protein